MKKLIWLLPLIAVIAIAGIIWLAIGSQGNNQKKEPIKIGLVGHFSGDYASYGIPMKNAVELAIGQINNNGGLNGRALSLVIEDDASDANNAASAMSKLINVDNANYIISAQGSGAAAVVSPIVQNSQRILMITLGSAPGLTEVGDYVFRSVPSDVYQGIKMAEFINQAVKPEKVAGLYVNDTYGIGIKDLAGKNIKAKLGAQEMFEAGATDFRSQLAKIKNDQADALILVSRKETPNILKQIKELGLENLKIIASETIKDDEILKQSGKTAEGLYVVFTDMPKDYVNFAGDYKNKFNEEPSAYSMYAYDGAMALIKALEKSGDNISEVKGSLAEVRFQGASGDFGLDQNRERVGMSYIIYLVKNGQFTVYGR